MRTIPVILTLFTLSFVLFGGTALFWKEKFAQIPQQASQVLSAPVTFVQEQVKNVTSNDITLLFVGDVMLDRGVEAAVKQNSPGESSVNWSWPFLPIADFLQEADLVFGNLESQISDKGTNVGSIYSFRADPESVQALQYGGFDVVSVANNHSFDYTKAAFDDSVARLQQAAITPLQEHLVIKEVQDTKIGFLAYSNFAVGVARVNWTNMPQIMQDIAAAKGKVDILAVSLHAGEEYAKEPNDFQQTFAESAIDSGADLLIGHHPHVLQPLEQYKQGWIIYSLGNFLFDQDFSAETMRGAILEVVVENKKIQEARLIPTRQNSSFQVKLAP